MNIPADRSGQINASVVETMRQVGLAINNTFRVDVVAQENMSGSCKEGMLELEVPKGAAFDYIVTMEDLAQGQRVANYSIDFQRSGSSAWEVLVPPVWANHSHAPAPLRDRPDGNDPRDSHIGRKRIDVPVVKTSGPGAVDIAKIRLNCIRALEEPIYIRKMSLHRRNVPWEA